jgi:CheY-like chemotaxis protein
MRIFISSTYEDLALHRERVAQAIERLGQERTRMEVFGAQPDNALKASLEEVAASEAFVGIYAHRYGFVPYGVGSITEIEFDEALRLELPMFCFIIEDDYPWPPTQVEMEPGRSKLLALKDRIKGTVVRETFTTPDDLAFKVSAALGRFLVKYSVMTALADASTTQRVGSQGAQDQVARRAERLEPILHGARVLLVNDVPAEMHHVLRILRSLGLEVLVATTTEVGLAMLQVNECDVVISDMRRGDDAQAGTKLMAAMRAQNLYRPTILTPGRYLPELGTPPYAFGITNRVDELLNLLFDVLERARG